MTRVSFNSSRLCINVLIFGLMLSSVLYASFMWFVQHTVVQHSSLCSCLMTFTSLKHLMETDIIVYQVPFLGLCMYRSVTYVSPYICSTSLIVLALLLFLFNFVFRIMCFCKLTFQVVTYLRFCYYLFIHSFILISDSCFI